MRKNWLLLTIALLVAVVAIGAAACSDNADDGDETPTAQQTNDAAGAAGNDADDDMIDADDDMSDDADDDMDGDANDDNMVDDMAGDGATVIITDGILTDSAGNTLYVWDNDGPGVSNCADGCAGVWPPLTIAGEATAGDGVDGVLATFARDDGDTQATYNDRPLYYYAADEAPGDRNGDGVGGSWHIVPAGG